jgi:tRNA wybutosine-synthesizing protein 4
MRHFSKLEAPLRSIHKYPLLSDQEKRFIDTGWNHARARSLWDLWQDNSFLSSSKRISLDTFEPFDEWEEFALFASHYFLLSAFTNGTHIRRDYHGQMGFPHQSHSPFAFRLLSQCPLRFEGQRRYGALVPDGTSSLCVHGGLGRKSRLLSTDVYTRSRNFLKALWPLPPRDIPARMCHSVTSLSNGGCLIVGGRSSPRTVLNDCWERYGDEWKQSHRLPFPRFRHCAVRLGISDPDDYVLIYGGKSGSGDVLSDWVMWHAEGGWKSIDVVGHKPSGRFGASMVSINSCSGVLFGGLTQDGRILEDFWTWSVSRACNESIFVELRDHTDSLRLSTPFFGFIGRFGATANMTSMGLVIIGGIAVPGVLPSEYEIMLVSIREGQGDIACEVAWNEVVLSPVGPRVRFRGQPLLNGHVSCAVSSSEVLILSGGAVCFSFGTYWNEGTWLLLQDADSARHNPWVVVPKNLLSKEKPTRMMPEASRSHLGDDVREARQIERRHIRTSVEFQELLAEARPAVIPGADLGRCTALWTKEYLSRTVGPDRKVRPSPPWLRAMY